MKNTNNTVIALRGISIINAKFNQMKTEYYSFAASNSGYTKEQTLSLMYQNKGECLGMIEMLHAIGYMDNDVYEYWKNTVVVKAHEFYLEMMENNQ